MRIVLQRVSSACVTVDNAGAPSVVGRIGRGLLLLVGFGKDDTQDKIAPMLEKICHLRLFPAGENHFHVSVKDICGEILIVSQFTLYGSTAKGRRPDFFAAMEPNAASTLYDAFVQQAHALVGDAGGGIRAIQSGVFGAVMQVQLTNDGPVTLILEN